MRRLLTCFAIACISGAAQAGPDDDTAICGGQTAIVATWACGAVDTGELCTLWGVDTTHSGRWTDKSLFVVEGPKSAKRVAYAEACRDNRCSRPQYSVCSTPVSRGTPTPLETLLHR
jgi:hypothetical protein